MKERILEILSDIRPDNDFSEDVDFIEEELLDSYDMISLVDSLETEFNVCIDGTEILPENFCSLNAIQQMIEQKKK